MNLKDRMNAGSQNEDPIQDSANTMTKSNQQSQDLILQKQSETIQKQADEIQNLSRTVSDLQAQLDRVMPEWEHLKVQGRPEDIETIQKLSSQISKLTSATADLRAELSSAQRINRSLTKSNDDLRNNAGLLLRKEQERLAEELTNTRARLSDAEKKVDMSNVKAVLDAQAAKEAAEQKAAKNIAEYKRIADKKVSEAVRTKNTAIKNADNKAQSAVKNQNIAQGALLVTLLCCLIAHPTFVIDMWDFVYTPAMWIWGSMDGFLSAILTLICAAGAGYGVYRIWLYYRKRWCSLSQRILLASLSTVIIFGEGIHKYIDINLVTLFMIIQMLYLAILVYLDGYFKTHYREDAWKHIQNE